jgi:SHS2 domain-containing protein
MPGDKPYRIFNHTADLGLVITGRSLPELFAHAAEALSGLITKIEKVEPATARRLDVEGVDLANLWINFLREILSLFTVNEFLVRSCKIVHMDGHTLSAELLGEKFDAPRHIVKTEIKAVTYHQATVQQVQGGWEGKVVFDV